MPMKYAVARPQVRNVTFKYTDLTRVDIDLEAGPFDTEDEADEYNNREHDGNALVIAFADEYMENYPST